MTTTYTRILLARSHAATHRTQLLLSQCRHGCKPSAPGANAQSAWYAQQQQNFLDWLEAGGLAQTPAPATATTDNGSAIGNSGIAPLFPAPCMDADEELQFSQVRIRDAVK
jgi:hypothetical protein